MSELPSLPSSHLGPTFHQFFNNILLRSSPVFRTLYLCNGTCPRRRQSHLADSLLTPVHLKFLSSWVLLQSSVFVDDAVQSPTLFTSKWSVIEWHRHACRLLLTLMGRKAKYTEQELLGRRAQSAWEYRQRNKAKVNEKARLRMQATRAKVRAAPPAVRMGYAVWAAQHRRDYLERLRRGLATAKPALLTVSTKHLKTSVQRRLAQDKFVDANSCSRNLCYDTSSRRCAVSDDAPANR
ncbi:hypothetical protein R3P38DRAFT_3173125 [Favolaschia claudopus]|uniref:Uncharacterized protein n=1 Tax=Favolaschia claudopus TaxID=2862362 RepID=A0AAW0DR50_9AGAR